MPGSRLYRDELRPPLQKTPRRGVRATRKVFPLQPYRSAQGVARKSSCLRRTVFVYSCGEPMPLVIPRLYAIIDPAQVGGRSVEDVAAILNDFSYR